jgi:hypothetical protein
MSGYTSSQCCHYGGGSVGVNVTPWISVPSVRESGSQPHCRRDSGRDRASHRHAANDPGLRQHPRSIRDFGARLFHSDVAAALGKGISAGVNWTYTIADYGMTSLPQPRLQHNPDGTWFVRPDQAEYETLNKDIGTPVHLLKANFVWSLPRVPPGSNLLTRAAAILANDWQVSGVFTADTGSANSINYIYQNGGGT